MELKEFIERTGLADIDPKYYHDVIEQLYYRSDKDKDNFCEMIKPVYGSAFLEEFAPKMLLAWDCNKIYREERKEAAQDIIDICNTYNLGDEARSELETKAIALASTADVIKYKVSKGYALTKADLEYISENLR